MSRDTDSAARKRPGTASDTAERRGAERMRVSEPATVQTPGCDIPVRLLEVSAQGACIQVDRAFEGEVLALTIPFTRDPAEAERFVARVVHRQGNILGVEWVEVPSFDARFKIARLMERERGTPTVLIGALPMLQWPSARARQR